VPLSLNFPQLDFVKPLSGFHPVTWERVTEAFGCLLVERHAKMKQRFHDEACCNFNE